MAIKYNPIFTPALQMGLNAYGQSRQRRLQDEAMEDQQNRNQMLGQMLGGSELAMADPMAYMQGKQFLNQQAKLKASPEDQQLIQTLTTQALGGNQEAFNKLAGIDPKAAKDLQAIIKSRSGITAGTDKALEQKKQQFAEWRNNTMTALANSDEEQRPNLYSYFRQQANDLFPEIGQGLPKEYDENIKRTVDAFDATEEQLPTSRYRFGTEGEREDVYRYDSTTGERKLVQEGAPKTPKLTAFGEREMGKLQDASVEASISANRFDDLATRFEEAKPAAGIFGSVWESFKDVTGQQDLDSLLKREFNSSRMKLVLKALPPGPATDVDVRNAMKGVPPESANSESIASFLRGMAKIEKMAAITADVKSQWYEQNTSSGLAKKDFEIDGQIFKKGSRLNDAIEKVVSRQMPPSWTKEQQVIVDQLRSLNMTEAEIMDYLGNR